MRATPEQQSDLAASYSKFGDVYAKQGKRNDALESYHQALAIAERLASSDPSNARARADVIEFNYDIATNGEDSARRFAFMTDQLTLLKADHALTVEQSGWLAKAQMKSKKTGMK
jgi:tetratricopeptide (TPR) repeat protein